MVETHAPHYLIKQVMFLFLQRSLSVSRIVYTEVCNHGSPVALAIHTTELSS